jgi:3'-phosphoadenosine 5'-phosphosulfate (PAPS) 3'-phosphatase
LELLLLHDVLSHWLAAGRQAAKLLKESFGKSLSFSLKHDNSLVTRVDNESQELLMSYLKKQFPSVPS